MARNELVSVPLRLSKEHLARLDKAATYCSQSRQAFMQAAILADVADVEERRRMKQLRTSRNSELIRAPQLDTEIDAAAAPTGMGVADVIRRQRDAEAQAQTPAAVQQAPVVVNVGSNGTSHGDAIERLAAYVAAGSEFERESRLRTAVNVLYVSTQTDEERRVIAARLDEAVAAKLKTTNDEGGSMTRVARLAFDKLRGLLP